jgi:hypothetical protein
MQTVVPLQETPASPLDVVTAGFGVDWMLQLVPFQRSASGCFRP